MEKEEYPKDAIEAVRRHLNEEEKRQRLGPIKAKVGLNQARLNRSRKFESKVAAKKAKVKQIKEARKLLEEKEGGAGCRPCRGERRRGGGTGGRRGRRDSGEGDS